MAEFRDWLLIEGLNVNAVLGLEELVPQAKTALTLYLKRYGTDLELNAAEPRYQYTLVKYEKSYAFKDSGTFYFKYDVLDKGKGRPEVIKDKSDWRYAYHTASNQPGEWDGKTGHKVYKTPKDALQEIPANPALAYRGMSWEEWKSIQKKGFIQSAGLHNFSNQETLTFYGPDPATAENYAGSFAPAAFKPTPTRPGMVIAVPKSLLKTHKEHPGIPADELAHTGPLSATHIVHAWMLVVTKLKSGSFDITMQNGKVSEGSRSSIGVGYAIRQMK